MTTACFCGAVFDSETNARCPYCDEIGTADQTIADYLRGACAAKVITSWSHPAPNLWYVNPNRGPTQQLDRANAADYAGMLREAGVEPRPLRIVGGA